MKPIRQERTLEILHEPWATEARPFREEDVFHFVNDAGGLESRTLSRQVAYDCGCLDKPRGGFCADCVSEGARGLVCSSCFSHCEGGGCGQPVCPRHSLPTRVDGRQVRLCISCHQAARRKQITRGIVRTLLSPFVIFEDDEA